MNQLYYFIDVNNGVNAIISYYSNSGYIEDPIKNAKVYNIIYVDSAEIYTRIYDKPIKNTIGLTKKTIDIILIKTKHVLASLDFENLDPNSSDIQTGSNQGNLSGTYYEYVLANGTDTENATELQAAYTTAKSKVVTEEIETPIDGFRFDVSIGDLYIFFPSPLDISLIVGKTYTIILDGVEYTGVVQFYSEFDMYLTSVTAPDGMYSTMSIVSSTTKKASVVVAPGFYNFATDFIADDGNVDIVSLDGNRSVIFNGDGTISVTGDGAYIKGIDVGDKSFTIADDLPNITIVNCKGGDNSFTNTTVSGTFIDCEGGIRCFGSYNSIVSGIFTRCTAGNYSFGENASTVSGIFTDCEGGMESFGGMSLSVASGIFTNCKGSGNNFGGYSSTASGTFRNCEGGAQCFGGGFGTANPTCSGILYNCIAGRNSFGGSGTLSGKLFFCRLKQPSFTFPTVSGGGITRYCIDGNNATNNQG